MFTNGLQQSPLFYPETSTEHPNKDTASISYDDNLLQGRHSPLQATHMRDSTPSVWRQGDVRGTHQSIANREEAHSRAVKSLQNWAASGPSNEQFNRTQLVNLLKEIHVYANNDGEYEVEGDLFCNDFTGLIATHMPISLPNNLRVNGSMNMSHFNMTTAPKGLFITGDLYMNNCNILIKQYKSGEFQPTVQGNITPNIRA